MLVEHRAAFTALLWGGLSILVFFAPLFMYHSKFNEGEKQQGGNYGDDYIEMISEVVGLHIAITFVFLVAFSIINIIFSAVPDMQPKAGLENFYFTASGGGAEINDFINKWINNPTIMSTNAAPLSEVSKNSFIAARMLIGVVLTVLFVAIPLIILINSVKISIKKDSNKGYTPITTSVSKGAFYFLGATMILALHSLIASVLVKVAINNASFSFFGAIQKVWTKLLFGAAI